MLQIFFLFWCVISSYFIVLQGKKRGRKFIDPKQDKICTFRISGKTKPVDPENEASSRKKLVNFQFRESVPVDNAGQEQSSSNELLQSTQSSLPTNDFQIEEGNYKRHLTNYGIYIDEDDDYDYEQHLRDPNDCGGWGDEDVEVYTLLRQSKVSFLSISF